MAILTCQCGAKVRVPDGATGTFRCPRCQVALVASAAPVAAPVGAGAPSMPPPLPPPIPPGMDPQIRSIGDSSSSLASASCPTCQTGIAAHEAAVSCPSCGQPHHQECWDEVGGCAIYGCQSAPETVK